MPVTRTELDLLQQAGYTFEQPWQVVDLFEKKIAEFFGAPYAVATDSCTHALELCCQLHGRKKQSLKVPVHTYMSVPMMLDKIGQAWQFVDSTWSEQYRLDPLPIVDGARLWRANSYEPGTLLTLSFQFKKHIAIGRGGMILTDNLAHYTRLQRMVRDGRDRELLWANDDIAEIGYHYYMTPEDAARGILLFDELATVAPDKLWTWQDYKPLTEFSVFKHR